MGRDLQGDAVGRFAAILGAMVLALGVALVLIAVPPRRMRRCS